MRSVNKVILVGNLTRDPETRQAPNSQTVVTFNIATNREWMTKDGRKQNSTEYHELVAWARLADICSRFLKKGKLVYVEGYLKTRNWDSPEGVKKFKTEIVVQDLIMLDKREPGQNDYIPAENPAEAGNNGTGNGSLSTENVKTELNNHKLNNHRQKPPEEKPVKPDNNASGDPNGNTDSNASTNDNVNSSAKPEPVDIDTDLGL